MSSPAQSLNTSRIESAGYGAFDRFLRTRLLERLGQLSGGTLTVLDAHGSQRLGKSSGADPLHINLRVHSPGFYRAAASHG